VKPAEKTILAAVERAANAGDECPTNIELADLAGLNSVGASSGALSRLQQRGLVVIERGPMHRVVTIVATGKKTAGVVTVPHWSERGVKPVAPKPVPVSSPVLRPAPPPIAVDRTPCGFCGVRADYGCRHQRVAA